MDITRSFCEKCYFFSFSEAVVQRLLGNFSWLQCAQGKLCFIYFNHHSYWCRGTVLKTQSCHWQVKWLLHCLCVTLARIKSHSCKIIINNKKYISRCLKKSFSTLQIRCYFIVLHHVLVCCACSVVLCFVVLCFILLSYICAVLICCAKCFIMFSCVICCILLHFVSLFSFVVLCLTAFCCYITAAN